MTGIAAVSKMEAKLMMKSIISIIWHRYSIFCFRLLGPMTLPSLLWVLQQCQLCDLGLLSIIHVIIMYFIWTFSLSALGAAYGTAKSGTGIAAMSVMRPELIMKSIIPVIMAGIIAIYGLVVAALIANSIDAEYTLFK